MAKTIHQGRNIKHFREILNIKQEGLAMELGDDWNQRRISLLEQKEVIDDDILEQVAKVLKIPVETLKNHDIEGQVHNIQNNFDNAVIHSGPTLNYQCTFNPIDKIVELYEALVKSEREKIDLMQKILDKLK